MISQLNTVTRPELHNPIDKKSPPLSILNKQRCNNYNQYPIDTVQIFLADIYLISATDVLRIILSFSNILFSSAQDCNLCHCYVCEHLVNELFCF